MTYTTSKVRIQVVCLLLCVCGGGTAPLPHLLTRPVLEDAAAEIPRPAPSLSAQAQLDASEQWTWDTLSWSAVPQ